MVDSHKGKVLNFVRNVLARIAGDGGLELAGEVVKLLARQVIILDFLDGWGSVNNFVLGYPATGEPKMTRGTSPQPIKVLKFTDSSLSQMVGTSSIWIQCS